MYLLRFLTVIVFALYTVPASPQLRIDPSELRVSSAPYEPPSIFRGSAELVNLTAVVRDSSGRIVGGLNASDFEIREDGKVRPITAFTRHESSAGSASLSQGAAGEPGVSIAESSAPEQSVLLLIDNRNSTPAAMLELRTAALRMVDRGLDPRSRTAVYTTADREIETFTNDADRIRQAIQRVQARPPTGFGLTCPTFSPYIAFIIATTSDRTALESKLGELFRCDPRYSLSPTPGPNNVRIDSEPVQKLLSISRQLWREYESGARLTLTRTRDAVRRLSREPGRRVLVLLSSGFLAGTLLEEQDAIVDEALRTQVIVNSLDLNGLLAAATANAPPPLTERAAIYEQSLGLRPIQASTDVMVNFTSSTGGQFFNNRNDLETSLQVLTAIPDVRYSMAFPPARRDGRYHRIKVTLPKYKPKYRMEARAGFVSSDEAAGTTTSLRADEELLTASTIQEVPVVFTARSDGAQIQGSFAVDVRTIGLELRDGVHRQDLLFRMALLDRDGDFVAGRSGTMEFALKPETLTQLSGTRLDATLRVEAEPGEYTLRGLVQDSQGRLTATSLPLRVQ